MKVGIFSRWNATCGVSLHATLLVRALRELGHEVLVFAPTVESANRWWHHKIIQADENFVIRCYRERPPRSEEKGDIEFGKILPHRFDLFIVESYPSLPHRAVEQLLRLMDWHTVKVMVVHEGRREDLAYEDVSVFDAIAVFDSRYCREVLADGTKHVHIIPYPCRPTKANPRTFAEDGLRFISFGRQPIHEYSPYLEALARLSSKYRFAYQVVRCSEALPVQRPWLHQAFKTIREDDLYPLLQRADVHLIPKGQTDATVVSSTLFQCLGSLVPTVAPLTRHFELFDGSPNSPVVLFKNTSDLVEKLERLIGDREFRQRIVRNAVHYVKNNRDLNIARRFLQLYDDLFREKLAHRPLWKSA